MTHILQCSMQAAPEAPERILQVIRIRGFEIQSMQMRREGERFHLELRLGGERNLDNLVHQLNKLVGIKSVRTLSSLKTGYGAPASVMDISHG